MTSREMLKVAGVLDEVRPIYRALKQRGVSMTRDPAPSAFSRSVQDPKLISRVFGSKPKVIETINTHRGPGSIARWLHEAGHAMDTGGFRNLALRHPEISSRSSLIDEVLANRNIQRKLSPAMYSKILPTLQTGFKSHSMTNTLTQPVERTPAVQPLWNAAVRRISANVNAPGDEFTPIKSVRRQMARRSPEFKAQFKDQAFNLQDLLKQRP